MTTRRSFVLSALAAPILEAATGPSVSFGVVADLHHGLMPDAHDRLRAFLTASQSRKLDFLIQLGDFCHPVPEAREFLRDWHAASFPKYSVLGNHDMDKGSKRQILDELRMPKSYYSFDRGGFHFAVLDCNYIHRNGRFLDFDQGNYFKAPKERDWVSAEQVEWLEADLESSRLPSIVFAHQPVYSHWGRPPAEERRAVREVFARVKAKRPDAVVASFSGHEHVDDHRTFEGVDYFYINSASYHWVGEEFGGLAKYRDPLYAFVTIRDGKLTIEGRASQWIAPSPAERKHPNAGLATPNISSREIRLAK